MLETAQRIEGLRRRIEKDPASIAFAQLAEELRRAGQMQEAVEICRAGLAMHPTYLSARVTLGRALLELNQLDTAQAEMEQVLKAAADNLAALRALGDVFHRRGDLESSLDRYRTALELAPNDPDLEETVQTLTREIAAQAEARAAAQAETQAAVQAEAQPAAYPAIPGEPSTVISVEPVSMGAAAPTALERAPSADSAQTDLDLAVSFVSEPVDPERERALRTLAALESWLDAINVSRAVSHA